MTRDAITLLEPAFDATVDNTKSIYTVDFSSAQAVDYSKGIVLQNAFEAKDDSVYIVVENTTKESTTPVASEVTIKAGDSYPNKILGDLTFEVGAGKTTIITIEDQSRFENKDGSVNIDFKSGFTGNIYAIGKHAGVFLPS